MRHDIGSVGTVSNVSQQKEKINSRLDTPNEEQSPTSMPPRNLEANHGNIQSFKLPTI